MIKLTDQIRVSLVLAIANRPIVEAPTFTTVGEVIDLESKFHYLLLPEAIKSLVASVKHRIEE